MGVGGNFSFLRDTTIHTDTLIRDQHFAAGDTFGYRMHHRRRAHDSSRVDARAKSQVHTTGGIPRWSPTLVLVTRFSAYVWQSGRDAQFSLTYGRMYPRSRY
jgi:hypothetical protein